MVHSKAIIAIRNNFHELITNAEYYNGQVTDSTIRDNLEKTLHHLDNKFGKWADARVFNDIIYEFISLPHGHDGKLNELYDDEHIESLVDRFIELVCNIPYEYYVYVPMNTDCFGADEFVITNGISIVQRAREPETTESLMLRDIMDYPNGRPFLRITSKGIISAGSGTTWETPVIRDALSICKKFLYLSKIRKILQHGYRRIQKNRHIYVKSITSTDYQPILMPANFIDYVSCIEWNDEDNNWLGFLRNIEAETKQNLLPIINLINSQNKIYDQINAAIEWAFDAQVNDNKTFSFIQLCIALEAIIGESSGSESITKTIADRCAFYIANSKNQREEIIKDVKEIYNIRSNLVHGKEVRLSKVNEQYYKKLTWIFDTVINKELQLIQSTQQ
ncbi:MAG TPA: hypothetical protein DCS13_02775 [Candidatus Margulisbacteria bacterium]|nr:hypothetical protein [Candidatus Margulisiibacteriota bacterium]